jgi:hypothetical protein
MQGGPRMHQACLQIALMGERCGIHQGIHMCKQDQCRSTTKNKLCVTHERERIYREKQSIPIASIRKREHYYLIQGTNFIIDPGYRALTGYMKDEIIYYKKNEQVEQACLYYHLPFLETGQSLDSIELN